MKRALYLILIIPLCVNAQPDIKLNLSGTVTSNKINCYDEKLILNQAQNINILGIKKIDNGNAVDPYILISVDGNPHYIDYKIINDIKLDSSGTISQLWQKIQLENGTYKSLMIHGYQNHLRKELEEESLDMLSEFKKSDLFYEDEYLEDYLQRLLYRVHPITLKNGRPGNLRVRILKNPKPNAFALPNGMILVNTGLISSVNGEVELLGILAKEVAHIVLDHQLININEEAERQKRAEFWANFAAAIAAAGDVYLDTQSDAYTAGKLTASTAAIANTIAQEAIARFGLNYSQEQERKADEVSKHVLAQLGLPSPAQTTSSSFQKKISMVNTFNAFHQLHSYHLLAAENLVDRNINAGVPTEDDYIIKAIISRQLNDTRENNEIALELLNKAETLNINPRYGLYKQKAITLMRLERYNEAISAFGEYLENLYKSETGSTGSNREYINKEIEWTRAMIYKAGRM